MADPVSDDQIHPTLNNINLHCLPASHGPREEDTETQLSSPTSASLQERITSAHDPAQECDTPQAESRCYLMELPTELRLRIIELLFYDELDETHCLEESEFTTALWKHQRFYATRHMKAALALAHTNQVMRAEAIPTCKAVAKRVKVAVQAERDDPAVGWTQIEEKFYFFLTCKMIMKDLKYWLQMVADDYFF